MEKQRDKAAQRMQRKLAREAGISLDGTDEFGSPLEGAAAVVEPPDGTDANGETTKPADEATGVKE